ncbi:MAG: UbiA family prenyltransferase, partial [Dinghuibacter sp.]|nr:UbiA family prenyltransferase [Dinghuibacter sp.]
LQFPLVALLYYGIDNNIFPGFNLRRIGWLKPFLIGWVWAGLVTLYPLVYAHLVQQQPFALTQPVLLFFLQNFLFVSVISVMFDIKDYAADSNRQLKTFVVRNGLRKTIFALLIPLSVAGWAVYFLFVLNNGASMVILLLSSVPFLFLVLMANSLSQRRTILFYLVVIDGLMLVKALCGIVSALYF